MSIEDDIFIKEFKDFMGLSDSELADILDKDPERNKKK